MKALVDEILKLKGVILHSKRSSRRATARRRLRHDMGEGVLDESVPKTGRRCFGGSGCGKGGVSRSGRLFKVKDTDVCAFPHTHTHTHTHLTLNIKHLDSLGRHDLRVCLVW